MEHVFIQRALEALGGPPSQAALLELIRWLDREAAQAAPVSLHQQLITRLLVAAGSELVAAQGLSARHPVVTTLTAAMQYCLEPTVEHFDYYVAAATASYPFGAGEGCYALAELGAVGCEPGSGCRSGAGSLAIVATEVGVAVVWQRIVQDVIPWLRGEADPLAERASAGQR